MARRVVSLCLIVSLLLIGWYARLTLADAGSPSAGRVLLGLIASIVVPYVLALIVLAVGRRARGIALAGGTALVALVPITPFVGVTLLFIGFSTTREQVTAVLVAAGFVIVQLILLGAAIAAHRALPGEERVGGAWAVGIAAPMMYAFLWLGAARGTTLMTKQRRKGSQESEHAARQAVRTIRGCLVRYADAHPARGFPAALADVGPAGSACLSEDLGSEERGYRVTYLPGVTDARGVVHLFSLCAEPLRYARTGCTTFTADENGDGVEAYPTGSKDEAAVSCPAAWRLQAGMLRAVKHCLLQYAARSPAHGYPATLTPLAADGCLVLEGLHVSDGGRSSFWTGDDRYSYDPGPADDNGLIRMFELRQASRSGSRSVLIDETGAVHEAEEREATREDPAPEVGEERRCREDGNVHVCLSLAWKLEIGRGVRTDPARALDLYEFACGRDDVQGCLGGGSLFDRVPELAADPRRMVTLLERACTLGNVNGCEQWRLAAAKAVASP